MPDTDRNLVEVCNSFPRLPHPLIQRADYVLTIANFFKNGIQVVAVTGEEGIGKTTLAAQFAQQYPRTTISVFVGGTSRWLHDPDIVRLDLANQMHFAVHGEELPDDAWAHGSAHRKSLFGLQRLARKTGQPFVFVIDGLDDIPQEEEASRQEILAELPLGLPNLAFLVTGHRTGKCLREHADLRIEEIQLPCFLPEQANEYFADLGVGHEDMRQIWVTCGGKPGHLASVRRIVAGGMDVHALLADMPQQLPGLFEIEWRRVDDCGEPTRQTLALLAHGAEGMTARELAVVAGAQADSVAAGVAELSFVARGPAGVIDYVSQPFRRYAVDRLSDLEGWATAALIAHYLAEPESDSAMVRLPGLLRRAGRLRELIDYLSTDNLTTMLGAARSPASMRGPIAAAVKAATDVGDQGARLRLSLQSSMLLGLAQAQLHASEVQARLALGQLDVALELAQSATTPEDRLYLLAVVARWQKERTGAAPADTIEQLSLLHGQVDAASLGSKAVDIASELFCTCPDLAVSLIEASPDQEADENAMDWALLRLSLNVLRPDAQQDGTGELFQELTAHIRAPAARAISIAAGASLGQCSADDVLREAQRLVRTGDRLFLLGLWAELNPEHEGASTVVEEGLRTFVAATEYAPNAKVLRQLATPLPYEADVESRARLIALCDAQLRLADRLGPSSEYVGAQMLLCAAQLGHNLSAAANRLIGVHLFICEIDDPSTQASCWAEVLAALQEFDSDGVLEAAAQVRSEIDSEMERCVSELLAGTGEQLLGIRSALRALAKYDLDRAAEWAQKLNTSLRRDVALLEAITAAVTTSSCQAPPPGIWSAVSRIRNDHFRDEAILTTVTALADGKCPVTEGWSHAQQAHQQVLSVRIPADACRGICMTLLALARCGEPGATDMTTGLLSELTDRWQAIDRHWERADVGFQIAKVLTDDYPEYVSLHLQQLQTLVDEAQIHCGAAAHAHGLAVSLGIRAVAGLLPRKAESDALVHALHQLIEWLPSHVETCALWADLAVWHDRANRPNDCKAIVGTHISPLLSELRTSSPAEHSSALVEAAPAVYRASPVVARHQFDELPPAARQQAYRNVVEYLFRHAPLSEPFDVHAGTVYRVALDDMLEICELSRELTADTSIVAVARRLADSIAAEANKFSSNQRESIAGTLDEIIGERLPAPDGIGHNGYVLVARAHVGRIRREGPQYWLDLAEAAAEIPNTSDMVFTRAAIACSIPSKHHEHRTRLLRSAISAVPDIPTALERLARYRDIADMASDVDRPIARECLELIEVGAVEGEEREVVRLLRAAVDTAYGIDKELASSLASLCDDDPARHHILHAARRRLDILQLWRQLADDGLDGHMQASADPKDLAQVARLLHGAVNSGRAVPARIEQTLPFADMGADLAFQNAYPLFAWLLANADMRLAQTEQASTSLYSLANATLQAAELGYAVLSRCRNRPPTRITARSEPSGGVLTVRPGQRAQAIAFITDWLRRTQPEHLRICDPYMGPESLEALMIVRSVCPDCSIVLLCGRQHHLNEKVPEPWDEAYKAAWHRMTLQSPPTARVLIMGTEASNRFPIHDRWWITTGSGLFLGTSFRSLGADRVADIRVIDELDARAKAELFDTYAGGGVLKHEGQRLLLTAFDL